MRKSRTLPEGFISEHFEYGEGNLITDRFAPQEYYQRLDRERQKFFLSPEEGTAEQRRFEENGYKYDGGDKMWVALGGVQRFKWNWRVEKWESCVIEEQMVVQGRTSEGNELRSRERVVKFTGEYPDFLYGLPGAEAKELSLQEIEEKPFTCPWPGCQFRATTMGRINAHIVRTHQPRKPRRKRRRRETQTD